MAILAAQMFAIIGIVLTVSALYVLVDGKGRLFLSLGGGAGAAFLTAACLEGSLPIIGL